MLATHRERRCLTKKAIRLYRLDAEFPLGKSRQTIHPGLERGNLPLEGARVIG